MSHDFININAWYFKVGDSSPGAQVFNTATGAFVANSNATFQTWLQSSNPLEYSGGGISNVTNNGSGLCRVTVPDTSLYTTNMEVFIANVVGATQANGLFPITVISTTTFDLQGSSPPSAYVSGGNVYSATPINTAANLIKLIQSAQLKNLLANVAGGWSYNSVGFGGSGSLTDPLGAVNDVVASVGALTISMPTVNLPTSSAVPGRPIIVRNNDNTNSYTLQDAAGTNFSIVMAPKTAVLLSLNNWASLTATNGEWSIEMIGMGDAFNGQVGANEFFAGPKTADAPANFRKIDSADFSAMSNPPIPVGVLPGVQVKVGSFTRDTSTASGTQAITGVGFQPKTVVFLAGDTSGSSDCSVGYSDGSANETLANFNAVSANQWQAFTTQAIRLIQSGSDVYTATVQSLDANGFTISWTKTGSPTGTKTINYLAIR